MFIFFFFTKLALIIEKPCKRNHVEILRTSTYSVRMQENTDQKNSEYGHFSRSEPDLFYYYTNWIRAQTIEIAREIREL